MATAVEQRVAHLEPCDLVQAYEPVESPWLKCPVRKHAATIRAAPARTYYPDFIITKLEAPLRASVRTQTWISKLQEQVVKTLIDTATSLLKEFGQYPVSANLLFIRGGLGYCHFALKRVKAPFDRKNIELLIKMVDYIQSCKGIYEDTLGKKGTLQEKDLTQLDNCFSGIEQACVQLSVMPRFEDADFAELARSV